MHRVLQQHNESLTRAYCEHPELIREHHGIEVTVLAGGYGYRQIMELVQNGADAILEACEAGLPCAAGNRVHVVIKGQFLYVANTGAPLSPEGLKALLSSHSSPKRGNQIGRFGLGFKSLLRIGNRIDLFTRHNGAVRFNPARCAEELRREFQVTEAPGLRLAWPLEDSERSRDGVLEELAWAETIVRVEVSRPATLDELRREIREFPAEFLLFFPTPTALLLDDAEQPPRELAVEHQGDDQLLHDGPQTSRWRVGSRYVAVTDERALEDATHIHSRGSERLPVSWALPIEGRSEEAGQFWAFLPTQTPTHLPGIVNAPWKLNSDRNAIIGGEWNRALMSEAASLIAEALPSLSTSENPARPLDAFPRRMERSDEPAAPLVDALWMALCDTAVVPDATGALRHARELRLHPRGSAELASHWQKLAGPEDLARFVHSGCMKRQRGSRLSALAERLRARESTKSLGPNLSRCEAEEWFDAVATTNADVAVRVLQLAEAYSDDCKPHEWNPIRMSLSIIPSHDGNLVTSTQAVFAPAGVDVPGRAPVASAVGDDAEARRILSDVMGVPALDDDFWESMLRASLPAWNETSDEAWCEFWKRFRLAPVDVGENLIKTHRDRIRVRRRDGKWMPPDVVLLPGVLVSEEDSSGNLGVLIDSRMHGEDSAAVSSLGVSDCPDGTDWSCGSGGLEEWLEHARDSYKRTYRNSASRNYLEPYRLDMPRGWRLLLELSEGPNARLTERYLARIAEGDFAEHVKIRHKTRSSAYPNLDVPSALLWLMLMDGELQVGDDTVSLGAVVARYQQPVLAWQLRSSNLSGAIEVLQRASDAYPAADGEIRLLWRTLIGVLATPAAVADDSLKDLWAAAASDGVVPVSLPGESRDVPLSQVFVTRSADLARRTRTHERIVVTLGEPALEVWAHRGARRLSEVVSPQWTSSIGPPDRLLSAAPELADVLRDDPEDAMGSRQVSNLRLMIDEDAVAVPCLMWESTLLLDSGQLAQHTRAERTALIIAQIAGAGWLGCSAEEALQRVADARVDELRAHVSDGGTLAERLVRAVGNRREPLLAALGNIEHLEFLEICTLEDLAELTLAQLGPATLPTLRDSLEEEGLKPPSRWSTSGARAFVATLGFPQAFAVSQKVRPDPEEFVSGPIELPPLHDFQDEVLAGMRALLASGTSRRRAVISLPTGGGKTRVAVEGAVRLVLEPEGPRRSVVWVAQTAELCEQAVQAFRQVWINLGAKDTDLRISRLWGGNPNPAGLDSGGPLVVVASIQTLNSRMGTEELTWLRQPGLVVVDECHHAITPSYTNLLRWLDAAGPSRTEVEEPPILGLSATPFRVDDEESLRLARRFDTRWFPHDQEGLHARLTARGVLAVAEYEPLRTGAGLLDEEVESLASLPEPWEGLDFENIMTGINRRLAGNAERNRRLVERIQQGSEEAVLFFGNSVEHCEEMSLRLNHAGVSAAAVSGGTPTAARRYFLDRFRNGEIRVLCNHSVLTTGFDAPKTDMILISRQVFSPVRYMQIVGRGLRGEKNGGKARCQIVTAIDNLGRFEGRHAYHYCQQYFAE